MSTKLAWKKGLLSNTYQIHSGSEKIGELMSKYFRQNASGVLYGKQYRFETRGFFNQSSIIVDGETNIEIGTITYNTWHTKATITVFKKEYQWKYNNVWNTRWSLFENGNLKVDNSGTSLSGSIESNDNDALLILSSLFVTNYYWQSTIAVSIALIPVYINLFS